jgi:hypothetical protein
MSKHMVMLAAAAAVGLMAFNSKAWSPQGNAPSTLSEEVDSSLIDRVSYDADTETLTITFDNGHVYDYQDVPQKVYDGLMKAESKGRYFNQHIKGKYEYVKK